ncbi:RNA polymerase sigma factor [Kurthia huakuii]|uniref:RNA polymerase sigma factor n=1 Tax=Kurthia huakuii TaxID=1421019 RepID=UPI0004951A09|nr:RNA polymerase sigma factor [Kurthia huakuii]MBM7700507.1 RNA polymerase sigma-70 factor (ECF subfamily) [Kurthia huakuii]
MDDAQLIQKIMNGDKMAANELIERYYDMIYRYICHMGCSIETAKDITQDVFITMMQSLPTYKEQGYFRAWLYRIAHNQTMNTLKKSSNEKRRMQREKMEDVAPDFSEQRVNRELLKNLLSQLPVKQRDAIVLKYYHGFTAKEIANITNSTLPGVKSRLFQALRKLKARIKEEEIIE